LTLRLLRDFLGSGQIVVGENREKNGLMEEAKSCQKNKGEFINLGFVIGLGRWAGVLHSSVACKKIKILYNFNF